MKKLSIDQKDLFFAFENRMPETNHYLNLETGEIIPVFNINRQKFLEEQKQNPEKYAKIRPFGAKAGFQIMKEYVETIPIPKLQKELKEAIMKTGAFRSFREVIDKYPAEKKLWIEFRRRAILKKIKDWLAKFDVELELKALDNKHKRR
ncbi:MAG: UPF0158 family protein [candidate division WOR-3 bacterium]|nr:UPF0158 family protein [candidate division WOR-3 bacterium]MDH5684563.1 UPF0158 family protein [candidate division WOR-3 bacterium]